MKRLWPFVIVGALAASAAGGWWLLAGPKQGASETAAPAAVDPLTEAVTLAIKGISLLQGEKGVEFWRLKAEWAGMHQENGEIDVQEPRVRYMMGEGEKPDYLFAQSKSGRITDQQRVLTMWDDVKVTRNADTVTGPRLIYTADDRIMRFPDGAKVDSASMFGTLGTLAWNMPQNTIEGSGGVDLTFRAQAADAAAGGASESAMPATAPPVAATAPVAPMPQGSPTILPGVTHDVEPCVDPRSVSTPETVIVPEAVPAILPSSPAKAATSADKAAESAPEKASARTADKAPDKATGTTQARKTRTTQAPKATTTRDAQRARASTKQSDKESQVKKNKKTKRKQTAATKPKTTKRRDATKAAEPASKNNSTRTRTATGGKDQR